MHYFLDGYNLLFEQNQLEFALDSGRQAFIDDLEAKVAATKVDVTLVFDGRYRPGGREKSHYRSLEILFSSHGETADELILDELESCLDPRLEVVITRDRDLIYKVKKLRADAQAPSDFFKWLERKCRKSVLPEKPKKTVKAPPLPEKKEPKKSDLLEHYLDVFQKKLESDELQNPRKKAAIPVIDDYKRWLQLFEERLEHEQHS